VVAPLVIALAFLLTGSAGAEKDHVLVQLVPGAPPAEARALVAAGAEPVSAALRAYRLPAGAAEGLLPGLRARGALRTVELDRPAGTLQTTLDPLSAEEWWRAVIGVEGLEPPGPGVPVTIIDSGIDVNHPEFAGRPDTLTLNPQEPAGFGGEHGTGVASLIAAPANGIGIVGVYPRAVLRSWDAALGPGTELATSEIVRGLEEAARQGPGVINLSLGSRQRSSLIEQAVYLAFAQGSLVVAASGNDGDRGNALTYPASLPHVLTVGATTRGNRTAFFSSRSRFVDLAAPGEDITIASARSASYVRQSGTSFAAPFVAGAAAWVWTARPELDNTQLFEVMRRSATDIGAPGRDPESGFGLLNVGAALVLPAPPPDPLEPNDDVELAKPGGLFPGSGATLTTPAQPRALVRARLDAHADPRDVYRIWLPARRTVWISTGSSVDVNLAVWGPATTSVRQRPGADRLAVSARTGTGNERLRLPPAPRGRWAYVDVSRAPGVVEATYNLAVTATG
jgi:subtilisin family serine protease